MTVARAVKDELRGEMLGHIEPSHFSVTVIKESASMWRVQVFAPGEFYWLSVDNWTTELQAREAESAARRFLEKSALKRAAQAKGAP